MKKKNILTAAVSLSLVACLSIGATLAYFTDKTDVKTNTVTAGNVNIGVVDKLPDNYETTAKDHNWTASADGNGITYDHVVPGDTLDKIVGVEIMPGSEESWIGMELVVSSGNAELQRELVDEIKGKTLSGWNLVESSTKEDGTVRLVYAYENTVTYNPASGADNVNELFTQLHIKDTLGNSVADATFTITVQGFAMQAEHVQYSDFVTAMIGGGTNFETYVEPTTPVEP